MAGVVTRRRYVVGRDLRVISTAGDQVVLEGAVRLHPGTAIDLLDADVRTMEVVTWEVARLGSDGPVFRGRCRGAEPRG